ncbi:MAG TPA: relaxase/mobilization nuclease domain-containing protein [Bacteroidia bacterium]|nr:relaxase/mobilization nuclease domain-containing protein [Bacteroidia bacterium]
MYIYSDKGKMDKDTSFPAIYWNIPGSTPEAAIASLERCSESRNAKRKDAVSMHHEFLSFHAEDRPSIKAMEDLAYRWIELRSKGRDAVCFARAHLHSKALHVHFAFSGTDLQGKALSLNNDEFLEIRRQHERYQVEVYPELTRSIVYIDKEKLKMLPAKEADQKKRDQREFSRKKRTGNEKSHKDQCHDQVLESLVSSQTFSEFEKAVQAKGLGLYRKGSRLEGITFKGKKYRFRSLGLDISALRSIEQRRDSHEAYQRNVAALTSLRAPGKDREREK